MIIIIMIVVISRTTIVKTMLSGQLCGPLCALPLRPTRRRRAPSWLVQPYVAHSADRGLPQPSDASSAANSSSTSLWVSVQLNRPLTSKHTANARL